MMRSLFGCALAVAFALTAAVAAQNSHTHAPTPQDPTTEDQAGSNQAQAVTVEGCLMREADVPGRRPNIAERAGVGEDFILTSTKMIKGSAPGSGATAETRPGDTEVGTAGTQATLYQVEGIDHDVLQAHAGRRVQIDGTFETIERAKDAALRETTADDLVKIRGNTVREVPGECPPKQ